MKRSLVFHCFFAIWPGGRRCANCRNAHFLRGTVMKAYSHEKHARKKLWKNQKNKKNKSSDPWARSGERPGWGHGSELVVFFCFSMFFCSLAKTSRKKKSSDPWARSGERPGWGHGSELVDFCFLFFFHGFLQFGQNLEKTKKKKKKQVQTHGQGLGRGLAGDMGPCCFFLGFSMVFCSLAKTSRKPKKKKNKKFRPMGKVWGEAWLGTWVWFFSMIFLHSVGGSINSHKGGMPKMD